MPWYMVYACAEDDATGAVELTRDEFETVSKFFDNIDWFYSEGWHHGDSGIIDEEYNSKDDIITECKNNQAYDPDCFIERKDI